MEERSAALLERLRAAGVIQDVPETTTVMPESAAAEATPRGPFGDWLPWHDLSLEPTVAWSLPVTQALSRQLQSCDIRPLKGGTLVLIQHLKENFPAYLREFEALGVDRDRIFIVGIPYSAARCTLQWLLDQGFGGDGQRKTRFRIDSLPRMKVAVEEVFQAAVRAHGRSTGPFVVVDDGGHAIEWFCEPPAPDLPETQRRKRETQRRKREAILQTGGLVEQTARGAWAIDRVLKARARAKLQPPAFPIVDVARSALKNAHEPPLVGESIVLALDRVLREHRHDALPGKLVVVVGLGAIGGGCVDRLLARGARVVGVDANPTKRIPFHLRGLRTFNDLDGAFADLIRQGLGAPDAIIAATGSGDASDPDKRTFRAYDFRRLRVPTGHALVLISGSSKDVEYAWTEESGKDEPEGRQGLRDMVVSDPPPQMLSNNGRWYRLKVEYGGGDVMLFPTPVNFGFEAVPARVFEPIQALLLGAAAAVGASAKKMGLAPVGIDESLPEGLQLPPEPLQLWIGRALLGDIGLPAALAAPPVASIEVPVKYWFKPLPRRLQHAVLDAMRQREIQRLGQVLPSTPNGTDSDGHQPVKVVPESRLPTSASLWPTSEAQEVFGRITEFLLMGDGPHPPAQIQRVSRTLSDTELLDAMRRLGIRGGGLLLAPSAGPRVSKILQRARTVVKYFGPGLWEVLSDQEEAWRLPVLLPIQREEHE